MKIKLLPALVGALALGLGAISASAQVVTPAPNPTVAVVDPARNLGPALQAIIATHRDTAKALLEQRNAALVALKNATPAQRDAIVSDLRDIMKAHTADQRELAKAIRDAIKARRDQGPPRSS